MGWWGSPCRSYSWAARLQCTMNTHGRGVCYKTKVKRLYRWVMDFMVWFAWRAAGWPGRLRASKAKRGKVPAINPESSWSRKSELSLYIARASRVNPRYFPPLGLTPFRVIPFFKFAIWANPVNTSKPRSSLPVSTGDSWSFDRDC